jgi:hypothetical protein
MNTDDLNFAYKVRHALNEKLDDLPASATDRLAAARKMALVAQEGRCACRRGRARKRLRRHGQPVLLPAIVWLGRMSVIILLVLLVGGMVGIYQYEQEQHIAELAKSTLPCCRTNCRCQPIWTMASTPT